MTEDLLARKARERREAKEREAAEQKLQPGVVPEESPDSDLVPDGSKELSDEDKFMDVVIASIDIFDAYDKWGPGTPVNRKYTGSEPKVRCPWPEHHDDHPSASINHQSGLWHCHGTCEKGGDAVTLAAIKYGYPIPPTGEDFHNLRRQMAEDFGYTFQKKAYEPGYHILPPETDEQPAPATETTKPQLTVVSSLPPTEDGSDDDKFFYENSRAVNYKAFVKEGTFLDEWIKATYLDSTPEDYNFWHGVLALGLAAGRNVCFDDRHGTVFGNIFLCLLGPSGVGKSRSARHMDELLTKTKAWWDGTAEPPRGIKKLSSSSGEVMIQSFQCNYTPDVNKPEDVWRVPVKGLEEYNEFSDLLTRCNRSSSTLGDKLMALYDGKSPIQSQAITSGDNAAYEAFGSLVTTTQPRMLRKLVTQDQLNSGFANRFIFATGIPKIRDEFDYEEIDLSLAIQHYQVIQTWCDAGPHKLWFDGDKAKKMANEYWNDTIRPAINSDETQLLTRMSLVMKKMILFVGINEMRANIGTEQLERAFSIFDYITRAYGVSADRLGESKTGEIERLIINTVLDYQSKNNAGMSAAEFRRKFHRRKFDTQDIVRVFENLVKLGELDRIETKDGKVGRPTVKYRAAKA